MIIYVCVYNNHAVTITTIVLHYLGMDEMHKSLLTQLLGLFRNIGDITSVLNTICGFQEQVFLDAVLQI